MPLVRAELQREHQLLYPILTHDPSLVGYWSFDRDDGSYARDRSGYGNHGVIYGATLVPGKVGYARSFDGVDDYVEIRDVDWFDGRKPWTIAVWFKTGVYDDVYRRLLSDEDYAREPLYILRLTDANKLALELREEGGGWIGGLPLPYNPDEWNFHVWTYDGTTCKGYWNAVFQGQFSSTRTPGSSPRPLTLGRRSLGADFWVGLIDEVRIYNRALSADEIVRLMNMRGV